MPIIQFNPILGQSNYDLCLKAQGGLDGFVGFLISNGITLSSVMPSTSEYINYDTNNIVSRVLSGYNYATFPYSQGLVPLLNNDGTPLLNNNGQPIYNN